MFEVTTHFTNTVVLYSIGLVTVTGILTWEARINGEVVASGVVTRASDFPEPRTGAGNTYPIYIDPADFSGTAQVWQKQCYVWEADETVYSLDEFGQLVPAEKLICSVPAVPTTQDGRGFWWLTEVEGTKLSALLVAVVALGGVAMVAGIYFALKALVKYWANLRR